MRGTRGVAYGFRPRLGGSDIDEALGDGAEGAITADDDGGEGVIRELIVGDLIGALEKNVDGVAFGGESALQPFGDFYSASTAGDGVGENEEGWHENGLSARKKSPSP